MKFSVDYTKQALKELQKLNRHISSTIYRWIDKNLVDCEDPRLHGKALTADKKGLWRYRVGDYRLIADIQDEKILILVLAVGHRREVYK